MEFTGKNVVITGGARGMGKRFAVDLKNLGAKPYVLDVIQENLDALKNEAGIPGRLVDVTSEKNLETFFGVSILNIRKNKEATSFTVTKNSDLVNVIIPHFSTQKFSLQTQKE